MKYKKFNSDKESYSEIEKDINKFKQISSTSFSPMKYIKVNEEVNNDIDHDIINLGNSNTSINKSSKHPDYNLTNNKSDLQSEKEKVHTIVTIFTF